MMGQWCANLRKQRSEKNARKHALTRIQHYASGCIETFREYASQYQFDHAEQQLALLPMLQSRFTNVNLPVDLAALESLLTQYKEKKRRNKEIPTKGWTPEYRKLHKKCKKTWKTNSTDAEAIGKCAVTNKAP